MAKEFETNIFFKSLLTNKEFLSGVILSWLIFIAIDFLAHGSLLSLLWNIESEALKPKETLFRLVFFGYLGFFILDIFFILFFLSWFRKDPGFKRTLSFSLIIGFFYSVSQFLVAWSFINLPVAFLAIINFIYLPEIIGIILVFRYLFFSEQKSKRKIGIILILFFAAIIIGIVLQNILKVSN